MANDPPPAGDVSDAHQADACTAAVEAPLADLLVAAEAAGWHRAKIQATILEGTADALCQAERGEQT